MKYRMILQPLAERDLAEAFHWARNRAPETAARWLQRFQDKLESLCENPRRCGFAPEHRTVKRELRQMLFGRKPNVFRVIFVVDDDEIKVLRIRRASRRNLSPRDLLDN